MEWSQLRGRTETHLFKRRATDFTDGTDFLGKLPRRKIRVIRGQEFLPSEFRYILQGGGKWGKELDAGKDGRNAARMLGQHVLVSYLS
jgi:hypothetical protein